MDIIAVVMRGLQWQALHKLPDMPLDKDVQEELVQQMLGMVQKGKEEVAVDIMADSLIPELVYLLQPVEPAVRRLFPDTMVAMQ